MVCGAKLRHFAMQVEGRANPRGLWCVGFLRLLVAKAMADKQDAYATLEPITPMMAMPNLLIPL
jgi:hypothetical protein